MAEPQQRFEHGLLVATPGALELLGELEISPTSLLERHLMGDWGDLCAADRRENERSVKHGYRIVSSYNVGDNGRRVWVITEADRSATTILRPEDY